MAFFKTQNGQHYHITYGCSGATIVCGTEGLEQCTKCGLPNQQRNKSSDTSIVAGSQNQDSHSLVSSREDKTLLESITDLMNSASGSEKQLSAVQQMFVIDGEPITQDELETLLLWASELAEQSSKVLKEGQNVPAIPEVDEITPRLRILLSEKFAWRNSVTSSGRNRVQGGRHAKLTGHENEEKVAELIRTDASLQSRIIAKAHKTGTSIVKVTYGGIHEKHVPCILGKTTTPKPDIWAETDTGDMIRISLKKDRSSQVFLVGVDRFVKGFEARYTRHVPTKVKRALKLFFGGAEDVHDIINRYSTDDTSSDEHKQKRLNSKTLKSYNQDLYQSLLDWFGQNAPEICEYSLATGLAAGDENTADILIYRNLVDDNVHIDEVISIPDIISSIQSNIPSPSYGSAYGGTTILLPFGRVQMKDGKIQLRHDMNRILSLLRHD